MIQFDKFSFQFFTGECDMTNYLDDLKDVDLKDLDSVLKFSFKMGTERDVIQQQHDKMKESRDFVLDVMAQNSGIYVYTWSRDCDCVESDRVDHLKSREDFEKYCEECCTDAEGPVRIQIISRAEFEKFKPSTQDRIMEAFEDGRGTRATV